jgi:CheY-like chemotaxis protein
MGSSLLDRAGERARSATVSSESTDHGAPAQDRIENLRVLVVDDDAQTRAIIREALGLCGATVRVVPNAAMARSALAQWHPDAFISDIDMPDEDGFALIRYVRELPASEGGRIPAIAFTGLTREEQQRRMLNAGFDAVVTKLGALDTLIRTLRHVVEGSCDRARGALADIEPPPGTRDS